MLLEAFDLQLNVNCVAPGPAYLFSAWFFSPVRFPNSCVIAALWLCPHVAVAASWTAGGAPRCPGIQRTFLVLFHAIVYSCPAGLSRCMGYRVRYRTPR